jgi:hypothetical protein
MASSPFDPEPPKNAEDHEDRPFPEAAAQSGGKSSENIPESVKSVKKIIPVNTGRKRP